LGRKRTDLFIEWPVDVQGGYHGEVQRVVLELKILHKSLDSTLAEGLEQTARYADQCKADEAHLLIFDRRPGVDWETRIWREKRQQAGREIGVWGM
jgi:hypothetical protein